MKSDCFAVFFFLSCHCRLWGYYSSLILDNLERRHAITDVDVVTRSLEPFAVAPETGIFTQQGLVAVRQIDGDDAVVIMVLVQFLPIVLAWGGEPQGVVALVMGLFVRLGVNLFVSPLWSW
jgi:hypothetical protein